jgi:hypothetical protein
MPGPAGHRKTDRLTCRQFHPPSNRMGKSLNLKFPGVRFEDGLRKMLNTAPPLSSKSAKKTAIKPKRAKR